MAPRVAKDIVAYCKNCKMDLVHTIVAVHGDKVVRALCLTCKEEHVFRPPAGRKASARRPSSKKASGAAQVKSSAQDWEKAMEGMTDLQAKTYTLDGSFEAGEKIDHRTFGLGVVKKLIPPDKMEVLFKEGEKVLIRGERPDRASPVKGTAV